MQRGFANISKPPHTNKPAANENKRATGIEPAWPAWKAGTLPLSYARVLRLEICLSRAQCQDVFDAETSALHLLPRRFYSWDETFVVLLCLCCRLTDRSHGVRRCDVSSKSRRTRDRAW